MEYVGIPDCKESLKKKTTEEIPAEYSWGNSWKRLESLEGFEIKKIHQGYQTESLVKFPKESLEIT